MNVGKTAVTSTLILLLAPAAWAEDSFFHLPIASLTFSEGALPARSESSNFRRWQTLPALQPYAVLDGEGEVFIGGDGLQPWSPPGRLYENSPHAVRGAAGKNPSRYLFIPKTDLSGMAPLKFTIAAARAN